jgi:phage-related protein (TIGR01555 family)
LLQNIVRAVSRVRLDGWMNTLYGLGGTGDPARSTAFSSSTSSIYSLSEVRAMYEGDWLSRRIVDLLPQHALRTQPTVEGLPSGIESKDIWAAFRALDTVRHAQGVFSYSLSMGRLCGGHALLLGVSGKGALSSPETPAVIGPATTLAWLEECPVDYLQVLERDKDTRSPRYDLPTIYRITGGPRSGLKFHHSKVLLCEGRPMAPSLSGQVDYSPVSHIFQGWLGWGSVLTPVREALASDGISWAAASLLIKEASVGVMTMRGLAAMISQDDTADAEARMRVMATGKSVANTVFLDAEGQESFTRANVTWTGLPDLLRLSVQRVAGAAGIPATLLWQQAPAGLNATGESDMQGWYDSVGEYREKSITPKLTQILSLLAQTEITLKWEPVWSPTAKEASEIGKLQADRDVALIGAGVVTAERVAYSRAVDGTLGYDCGDIDTLQRRAEDADKAAEEGESEPDLEAVNLAAAAQVARGGASGANAGQAE